MLIDQVVSNERLELYCKALEDLSEHQLSHAFERALREVGDFIPSVHQLRRWSEESRSSEADRTREILTRDHLVKAAQKAKVTKEEIAEWLEAGKEKQREHIAKLHQDPEWHRMKERLETRR